MLFNTGGVSCIHSYFDAQVHSCKTTTKKTTNMRYRSGSALREWRRLRCAARSDHGSTHSCALFSMCSALAGALAALAGMFGKVSWGLSDVRANSYARSSHCSCVAWQLGADGDSLALQILLDVCQDAVLPYAISCTMVRCSLSLSMKRTWIQRTACADPVGSATAVRRRNARDQRAYAELLRQRTARDRLAYGHRHERCSQLCAIGMCSPNDIPFGSFVRTFAHLPPPASRLLAGLSCSKSTCPLGGSSARR